MTSERHIETPPIEDEGLRCLQCDYNLTGLIDSACPECGQAFAWDDLRNRMSGDGTPISLWGNAHGFALVGEFARAARAVVLHPVRFVRRLPGHPEVQSARRFSRWCHLAAVVVLSVGLFVDGPRSYAVTAALLAGVYVGMSVCVWVVAEILHDGLLLRGSVDQLRRGQVLPHMASCHGIVLAALATLAMLLPEGRSMDILLGALPFAIVGTLAWWWVEMQVMIWVVHRRKRAVIILGGLIPLAVVVGGVAGSLAFQLITTVLAAV